MSCYVMDQYRIFVVIITVMYMFRHVHLYLLDCEYVICRCYNYCVVSSSACQTHLHQKNRYSSYEELVQSLVTNGKGYHGMLGKRGCLKGGMHSEVCAMLN
jgi:hypothetical protein